MQYESKLCDTAIPLSAIEYPLRQFLCVYHHREGLVILVMFGYFQSAPSVMDRNGYLPFYNIDVNNTMKVEHCNVRHWLTVTLEFMFLNGKLFHCGYLK